MLGLRGNGSWWLWTVSCIDFYKFGAHAHRVATTLLPEPSWYAVVLVVFVVDVGGFDLWPAVSARWCVRGVCFRSVGCGGGGGSGQGCGWW